MVLPEFSFCVFSSLVLSKVHSILGVIWQYIYLFTNSHLEFLVDWMLSLFSFCLFEDTLTWLESKARLFEFILLGLLLIILVAYLDDWFGVAHCLELNKNTSNETPTKFQFGYRNYNGPFIWKEHYADALGQKQSPINILPSEALVCHCGPLDWVRYSDMPASMMMYNDGYSVTLNGDWMGERPILTGLPLENEVYIFNRLYFHWGPTDTEGSEHTVNYERFPLELHMIFVKENFNDVMDAHNDNCQRGIIIVVFLFEITPVDNPGFLNSVTNNLHKVRNPETGCTVEPFALSDIYPEFEFNYYRYDGSLTQPPCSEIVTYVIQSETIAVSGRQMSLFRKLLAFDGKPMVNNSRPVQKLNHRSVFYFTT